MNDHLTDSYKWYLEIHKKHKPFNLKEWIPPSFRDRIDSDGDIYFGIKYNRITKTHTYFIENSKTNKISGPYHGRTVNQFLKMKEHI